MMNLEQIRLDPSKLRAVRQKLNMRPTDAARKVGITPQRLNNYESGLRATPSNVLLRLCKLYGIEAAELASHYL